MSQPKNHLPIGGSLLLVVILWGGNNTGTKWLVDNAWPPVWTGGMRFFCAGLILLAVLRFTNWFGRFQPIVPELRKKLWLCGLSLAAYIAVFCWALKLTAASHVALYLGASPVWALLWEERPQRNWSSMRRYGAALLAVAGVLVLFWPALKSGIQTNLIGELCGLTASFMWANYSRQGRILSERMPSMEIAAHSMWMSGVWMMPLGLLEVWMHGLKVDARHLGVQSLCILFGSVVPYALWNNALRQWRASQVLLFNNLIPVTTALWVHFILGEAITSTFCVAVILIITGVVIGQADWAKIFKMPESF